MSEKMKKSSDEMTFFEHIDALRPHLVRGVMALLVMMVVAFLAKKFIIDLVLMGPQSPDFPTNRFLCHMSHLLMGDDTLCINQIKFNMVNTALSGQFNLHMQVAFVAAIVVAVPYLLWEIWRFVLPALTPRERHKSRMFVLYVSLCFFTGLLFGYYIITPLSINFFSTYQASAEITNMIDVKSYLSTVLHVSLACAIVFQLPLLVYFLTKMGLITTAFLKRYRRHAIVLLTVVSAVITPPDLFSLVLVVIPLYALYELSIHLAARVERKMAREEEQESGGTDDTPDNDPDTPESSAPAAAAVTRGNGEPSPAEEMHPEGAEAQPETGNAPQAPVAPAEPKIPEDDYRYISFEEDDEEEDPDTIYR